MKSEALEEGRLVRIFNPDSSGPIVYALDGQSFRNGLAPAMVFSTAAMIRGHALPRIVAIPSGAKRDRDFRPATSTPTHWRPTIAGQADRFDSFVMEELVPAIEGISAGQSRRYLMGHSLAGLYALDLATRDRATFDGIFVFAPTFSHDTSISNRLPKACRPNMDVYVNWGLESSRDIAIFEQTIAEWKASAQCQQNSPRIRQHPGAFHQIVMLTGQLEIAWWFLD